MYEQAAKTFGVPTPFVSFGVGLLSIVQSVVMILYFSGLVNFLAVIRTTDVSGWNDVTHKIPNAEIISILAIFMSSVKLIFSFILFFGQFYKSPGCFLSYFFASFLCLIGNLVVGSMGFKQIWTHNACIAVLVLVVFEKTGMIAILVIVIKMYARNRSTGDNPLSVSASCCGEIRNSQELRPYSHFKPFSFEQLGSISTPHISHHSASPLDVEFHNPK